MAEFHFYGTVEDSGRILDGLFALGFRVIPNRNYRTQSPAEFQAMDKGLAQAMSINKVLFVCGAFTKQPPAMSLMEAGSQKGTYVIDATLAKGGPLLKLSLPSNATEEGRFKLGPGSLFHPREYWDDATGTPMPPSDELTDAFRRLRKVIKDNTVLRRVPGKIWIGRDADRLFKDGVADVLIDGRWIPLKTLKQM